MSDSNLRHYAKHMLMSMVRYALIGALFLGGAALLLQGVFFVLGQMPHASAYGILQVTANWALIGGLFGGILGIIYGLLAARQ